MNKAMKVALTALTTVGLVGGVTLAGASAAEAATVRDCKIIRGAWDNHMQQDHGDIYAYTNYNWWEETVLGQRDGVKFYGTTSASNIGKRPYWVAGC
jgi:hypothetical protein